MIYGYVRVSSEKQRDNWSTEAQREFIQKFAAKHRDEYKIYDEVKSAKNVSGRPVFRKLLSDLKTDSYPIKRFWVVELTRLARNVGEADNLSEYFRKHQVEVYELDKQVSLDLAGERLNYHIKAAVAAHERELIGERISRAKKISADRGSFRNSALLGYNREFNTVTGESIWYIDDHEAKTVRKIFDDYLAGVSVNRIATELNRLGYRTKRNKKFEAVTVAKLLNHPYYFGLGYNSEGKIIESQVYKPILPYSREAFFEARAARKPLAAKFKYIRKDVSGLIQCSRCGANYYVHRKMNNGIEYLYLAHQTDRNIPCDQIPKYVDLEKHAQKLLEIYEESIRDVTCLSKLMVREQLVTPNLKSLEDESNRISKELERLAGKKAKLIEAVEDGMFSAEETRERISKINTEAERFETLRRDVTRQMSQIYNPPEATEEEVERRLQEFAAMSVGDRNLSYKRLIKSCTIEGGFVTLHRFDREIFQWEA